MFWTVIVLLLIAWSLGAEFRVGGAAIHLLLLAARSLMFGSWWTGRRLDA